ncbi:CDP-diacylglycerol--serine O-phosphatidyltransferase [Candidatus Hepatincolaceae symbiont of Richtersius coronifer]
MNKYNLYKTIPSLFTICAFIFGFKAIMLAIDGKIKEAIYFVLIASILDLVDGRVARLLRADSRFGAQLDSLSDMVCFGIATSIIVMFFYDFNSNFLFLSACFFSICAMLRLARFNLEIKYPSYYKNFFAGIPTPAGFGLGILPICFHYGFNINIDSLYYAWYLILVSFGMISSVPTPSTKTMVIPRSLLPLILALFALIVVSLVMYAWVALSFFGVIYLLGILGSVIIVLRKKHKISHIEKLDLSK